MNVISIADAGSDATYCPGDAAFLSANSPGTNETGQWIGSGSGISIDDPASPTSALTLAGDKSGTASLVWRIENSNGCSSSDTVVITNPGGEMPVNAGVDQTLDSCYSSTHSTSLAASYGGSGIDGQEGTWTAISGPNLPVFGNQNNNTTTVSNLIEGTYIFQWTVSGACVNGSDQVTIIVPGPTADLTEALVIGGDQVFCDGRTSTVLEGSTPLYVNETVEWSQPSGQGATIVSPNSPVTSVTGLDGLSSYDFTYVITNSLTGCTDTATVNVSYLTDAPSIDITDDQIFAGCGETFASIDYTFAGSGINQYSIISGPPTNGLTYPTSWASVGPSPMLINGLDSIGTYTIQFRRYTAVNVSCATAYDAVDVIISLAPTPANAGTFQILDCQVTTTDLVGNTPDVGQGTWSQVSGPTLVTLSDIHNPTITISNLANGFYTFQWTISGGSQCDPESDRVTVLVSNIVPTPVSAGPPQTVCFGTPVYMDADPPTYIFEIGTWTVVPGTGVVMDDIHNPKTEVNGLLENTVYTFTWTISNGCTPATGTDVLITVTNEIGQIASDAGTDQCLSSGTTSVILDGNDPVPGSGIWTKVSGPSATIADDTLYNTAVTGLTDGTYAFEWAISSGGCNPTRDTMLITIGNQIIANAGVDVEVCGDSARLTGNDPAPGTGYWTQISGNAGITITNPSNDTTDITNLQSGVYKFIWTLTNGACVSVDTVSAFVTFPAGSVADAGPDIDVCDSDSTYMAAVTPVVGTGLWTIYSGPNSPGISEPGSPTTLVNNLVTGDYIFLWTVSAGGYCPPSIDTLNLKATLSADAGADQAYCSAVTTTNLVGTTNSVGTWSQFGSTPNVATITPTSDNTATASGLITGVYTFVYSVTEPTCSSSDTMTVTLYDPASLAVAGDDQEHCNVIVFTMDADTPVIGTGTWSKLYGPVGGSFTDATEPKTTYTGAVPGIYIFEWTVSNDECTNADQVRVTNYDEPSNANAGPDQNQVCGTEATMDANYPAIGVGEWTLFAKPAGAPDPVIESLIQPQTLISNLVPAAYPGTYTFVWTISNGSCASKSDTVNITVYEDPTIADAGPDQEFCEQTSTNLEGNTITIGTGTWTLVSKPSGAADPTIVNPNNPQTQVNGLDFGIYIFEWVSVEVVCSYADSVKITNYENPTVADASGTVGNLCLYDPMVLDGNVPLVGTGLWTQVAGPAVTILNPASPQTDVVGAVEGTYQFAWTISNGICTYSSDTVPVVVYGIPSQAIAGSDQELCDVTTTALEGNTPDAGSTGTWSFVSGPNGVTFDNVNDPTTNVNGLVPGSPAVYKLQWSHSVGICDKSDTMLIRVWQAPSLADAGSDQYLCDATTTTMAAALPGVGIGKWTQFAGPNTATIVDTSSNVTDITGMIPGVYRFVFTISHGTCPPETDTVDIINYDQLQAVGPADQTICNDGSASLSVVATGGSGSYTYQWESSTTDCATGFAPIVGATSPSYTTPFLTQTTYYHCVVSDVGGVC
ncbi:MAG: hypothetical protein L3J79_03375, partial [Candidatus Marinimicrobia bacterium]|nr:hypothetical protein [Candidatus Neomarinimicrobiota bacterium]